jgi:FkbM family methyltransferase
MQAVKNFLVRLGPDNAFVRWALQLHGRKRGFRIQFSEEHIALKRDTRELWLSKDQYVQVPWMIDWYDFYFKTIESIEHGNRNLLDFSKPGVHRYIRNQAAFNFPSIPEDDVMDAYTHCYLPKPGEIVWDVGAHAGATTYSLAHLVGQSGKVYAFEPDERNFEYLKTNVESHRLENVVLVKKALSAATGTATFNMDGTMSAGLSGFPVYEDKRYTRSVPTISIPDACSDFGEAPNYIKMDIEGAEVIAIDAAKHFLKIRPIHFAIESNHRVGGELTCKALEQTFAGIGYQVHSSDKFGEMITWAGPQV